MDTNKINNALGNKKVNECDIEKTSSFSSGSLSDEFNSVFSDTSKNKNLLDVSDSSILLYPTKIKEQIIAIDYSDKEQKTKKIESQIKEEILDRKDFDYKYSDVDKSIKDALWQELSKNGYVESKTLETIVGKDSKQANNRIGNINNSQKIPDATPAQIAKLIKNGNQDISGFSRYKKYDENITMEQAKQRRLDEYIEATKNVPDSVSQKGSEAVQKYRNGVLSIIETSGELAPLYVKLIPDPENISKHADGLKRLSIASEKNQGCKFTNATLFNGFNAEELENKVVIPNEKLAKGEKVGAKGETLVIVSHEYGTDYNTAFNSFYKNNYMHNKQISIGEKNCKFDETFLGHYDSILVIQPTGKTADDTLNDGFFTISKGLDKDAKVDVTTIAHSDGGEPLLSVVKENPSSITKEMHVGDKLQPSSMMDNSDFVGKKAQPYSKYMGEIFQKSASNGHISRVIGQGCDTEFLQSTFNVSMPDGAVPEVMGNIGGSYGKVGIGFNKDKSGVMRFEFTSLQEIPSFDEKGIMDVRKGIDIESTQRELSPEETASLIKEGVPVIDSALTKGGAYNKQINKDYFEKGIKSGRVIKNELGETNDKGEPVKGIIFTYRIIED